MAAIVVLDVQTAPFPLKEGFVLFKATASQLLKDTAEVS